MTKLYTNPEVIKIANEGLKLAVKNGQSSVEYDLYKFTLYLSEEYNSKFVADLDGDECQYRMTSKSGHVFDIFTEEYSPYIVIKLVK